MSDYLIGLVIGLIIGMVLFYEPHTITYKEAINHNCGTYNLITDKFQFFK